MPKSVQKQKPLASKKTLPMSILGLLGLALVLVGIISVLGLMQVNQDDRSNASERLPDTSVADLMAVPMAADTPSSNVSKASVSSAKVNQRVLLRNFRITQGELQSNGKRKVIITWSQPPKSIDRASANADHLGVGCSTAQDLLTNPDKGPDGWYCVLPESKGDLSYTVPGGNCSSAGNCTYTMSLKRGVSYDLWVNGFYRGQWTAATEIKKVLIK